MQTASTSGSSDSWKPSPERLLKYQEREKQLAYSNIRLLANRGAYFPGGKGYALDDTLHTVHAVSEALRRLRSEGHVL
jgi:hypothetical protein